MKKIILLWTLILIATNISCQNIEYVPWGIWNCEPINENSPIRQLVSGRYYNSTYAFSWIAVSQNAQGIVAGNYNFPLLGIDGMFIRIERYERVDDGFIFHLIGNGFKREEIRTVFKDDTRLKLKMILLNENECKFQYYSSTDSDGFHLAFSVREDIIYRRYRVQ